MGMTDMMRIVTIGALLHDIGKAIIRASGERKTHSQLGADFLRPFCGISEAGEADLFIYHSCRSRWQRKKQWHP